MRIRSIEVTNFRNLLSVRVQPGRVAVIIGENGCGKSNLLHALRLLFDPTAQHLQASLTEQDINMEALKKGENFFTVKVEIGDLSKHADLKAVFAEWVNTDDSCGDYIRIQGSYAPEESGELAWEATVEPPAASKAKAGRFTQRMWRMLPLLFVDPVRDASREARVTRGSLLEQLIRDVDLGAVEADVRSVMDDADAKLAAAADLQSLNRNLDATAKALLPGGQARVSLSLAGHDTRDLLRTLQVVLAARAGEPGIPAHRHGTGFQNLLLIAMYKSLRERHADVHPMLVIEEPEAHIHPHAQRRLLRELEAIGCPTFITTHSPAIAASTQPQNIIRLQSASAAKTTVHQLSSDALAPEESHHFELMIRSGRADVFFARAAILVEGRSEALALPAFADLLGLDLDRDGVSILDAGGNAFEYALRVLAQDALSVPLVVTFDTDALKHDAQLVRTAAKLGLVKDADFARVRKESPGVGAKREALLKAAGWIPVTENFEYEVCSHGYLETAITAIEAHGKGDSLDRFLAEERLTKDATGVAAFLQRDKLKTAVAEAVATAARTIARVPPCYERALKNATDRAMQ